MPAMQSVTVKSLWRTERRARWFFAAHLQGALGTGAGYVALLLLAYEQLGSAWGATAVLIADLAPAMLLGPLLGGLIDRTSRLGCAIAAELIGALAFAGLIFANSTLALVGLALAAGLGSALLRPATCALLPAVVTPASLNAANGLFGAVREIGQLLGPAVAAGLLLLAEPELVLALNAITFALSAFLMTRLRGHVEPGTPDTAERRGGPEQRDRRAQGAVHPLAHPHFGCGDAGGRSDQRRRAGPGQGPARRRLQRLRPARRGLRLRDADRLAQRRPLRRKLRSRYLLAIALLGAGLLGTAAAPVLPLAMLAFAVAGVGNGLFLVTVRVLMQKLIPEPAHGRAFGLLDAIDSWGFGAAIVAGGALAASLGGRATFAIAGALALVVLFTAARVVRRGTPNFAPTLIPTT